MIKLLYINIQKNLSPLNQFREQEFNNTFLDTNVYAVQVFLQFQIYSYQIAFQQIPQINLDFYRNRNSMGFIINTIFVITIMTLVAWVIPLMMVI